ncbi:MAG: hypothetical protein ACYC0X_24495 [Pirellulaceae bacterium]
MTPPLRFPGMSAGQPAVGWTDVAAGSWANAEPITNIPTTASTLQELVNK